MAERYGALYGIDVEYFDKPFDQLDLARNATDHGNQRHNFIIFDCTDNLDARRSIENANIKNAYGIKSVIISCGNEDTFGQVFVSTGPPHCCMINTYADELERLVMQEKAYIGSSNMKGRTFINTVLPSLLTVFPDFKDTEKPSCTEIVLQNDQSMPINSLVAQLAYNAFYDIVAGKPLNYFMTKCNINNTFSTSYISNTEQVKQLLCRAIFGYCPDYKDLDQIFDGSKLIRNYSSLEEVVDRCEKLEEGMRLGFLNIVSDYQRRSYKKLWFVDLERLIAEYSNKKAA
jgi:hypothetical protein